MQDKLLTDHAKRIAQYNDPTYVSVKLFCKYAMAFAISFILGMGLAYQWNITPPASFRANGLMALPDSSSRSFIEFYSQVLRDSLYDLKYLIGLLIAAFTMFGAFVSGSICFMRGTLFGIQTYCLYQAMTLSFASPSLLFRFSLFILTELLMGALIARLAVDAEAFSLGSRRFIFTNRTPDFLRSFLSLLVSFLSSIGAVLILNGLWTILF